ncbi:MAG TPA: Rossmann-like and DUF2520 domain-containing protein [Terriglobia bacterium]|nr:Rossmann-like and DUF2520 domain-containing protein [Terriglobia bacterium]
MNARKQPIAIVGPGRLGQALGRLLNEEGFLVAYVAARRRAAARSAVRFIGTGVVVGMDSPELAAASVILFTTSDAALAPVARQVAALRKDWRGRVILHTSGSVPASVLLPFKRRGAAIGSLHPFQTIPYPSVGIRNLRGCMWGIEGDPAARRLAKRWVKAINGTTFQIRAGKKTLYHAAAFMVCPTLVTLMHHSVKLLKLSGASEIIARAMLSKIVAETAGNFFVFGSRRALTGPAVRGDWETIQKHVAELRRVIPEVLPAYRELVRLMAALAGRSIPAKVLGP